MQNNKEAKFKVYAPLNRKTLTQIIAKAAIIV